jgi:hypothetical protein
MKDEIIIPNSNEVGNLVERVFLVPEKGDILTAYGSEEELTVKDFFPPYLSVKVIGVDGENASIVLSEIDTINGEIVIG